jgi:hypothetical protein
VRNADERTRKSTKMKQLTAVAAVIGTTLGGAALGCGAAHDLTGDGASGGASSESASDDNSLVLAERRICDGSSEMRVAIAVFGGGQLAPFTSVFSELGFDFLYVDGSCHYWTHQPGTVVDTYQEWRPYREGVLTPAQERQLHDAVSYDGAQVGSTCGLGPVVLDGSGYSFWDGNEYRCFDGFPAGSTLQAELYVAGTAVTGPLRIQVGRDGLLPVQIVHDWPLDEPIDRYVIDYGETRSFRIDDGTAVSALRALREQALTEGAAGWGYFPNIIAIGPRDQDRSYVLSIRDELPFADADGRWSPAGNGAGTEAGP